MSGTLSGAFSISNQIDNGTIKLFDSLNLSIGAGYFIYLAAALREYGFSLNETLKTLENARNKVHIEVYIEKIDYLHRSGRINLGQFSLLKLFRLKPILNIIDGKLIKKGIAIGKKSGFNKITRRILKIDFGPNPVIFIGHATTPEVLPQFKGTISVLDPSRIIEINICNSLMAHTGIDAIGIGIAPNIESFFNNKYD